MDGFDKAAKIRKAPKSGRVRIIFVTAHGWTPDKVAKAAARHRGVRTQCQRKARLALDEVSRRPSNDSIRGEQT